MVSYFFASKINCWIVIYSPRLDPVQVKDQEEELPRTPMLMKPSSEVAKNRAQKVEPNILLLLPPELLLLMN